MRLAITAIGLVIAMSTSLWAQSRVAFVVGIERYKKSGLSDLSYAEDDARGVKAALEKLGFTTTSVIGDEATLANLNLKLTQFIADTKKLSKDDIAIVYLSGHGVQKVVQRKNSDGSSFELEEPFFCPNDALKSDENTMLSMNTLLKTLEVSSGSDHNIILMDACRDSADKSGKGGIDGSTIHELSDKLALFFASKSGRRSYESPKLEHGIFTHYLLEGLDGNAADTDGEITFQGLASYVSKQVERNSPVLLSVAVLDAQRPNLMGNLTGTIVLGKVDLTDPTIPPRSYTNKLGMKFMFIPSGEFMMGNEKSVDDLVKDYPGIVKANFAFSSNRHPVRITRPYYMGAHEVTVAQFRRFVEATGYITEAESKGKSALNIDETGKFVAAPSNSWKKTNFKQGDDHPVVNVSWNDAKKFCEWLSREENRRYRLPTEAEWEYACRAGTQTQFWHGNAEEGLEKTGNIKDLTAQQKYPEWRKTLAATDGFANTAPVGRYLANPWGLYDMNGNVWEWCSDWGDDYNLKAVSDPQGPTSGVDRILRGGGWNDSQSYCRSASRSTQVPSDQFDFSGFRVVRDLPRD